MTNPPNNANPPVTAFATPALAVCSAGLDAVGVGTLVVLVRLPVAEESLVVAVRLELFVGKTETVVCVAVVVLVMLNTLVLVVVGVAAGGVYAVPVPRRIVVVPVSAPASATMANGNEYWKIVSSFAAVEASSSRVMRRP